MIPSSANRSSGALVFLVLFIGGLFWALSGSGQVANATSIDIRRANTAANVVHPNGRTALMVAAREANITRVNELLVAGADVNRTNNNGGTPLMYAVLGADPQIVTLFLQKGAHVNDAAKNGWTALMVAVTKGYGNIVRLLLNAGADANQADVYLWTPLMRASFERRVEIVRILLQHPATDPDLQGENGITALHIAASQGHINIAQLLVAARARMDVLDNAGRTPQAVALAAKHPDLAELLQPRN